MAPGRGLICSSEQRFPPGESPRSPTPRETRETKRDLLCPRLHDGRWGIVATTRADYRPCIPVVGGDEMQDELSALCGQPLELVMLFDVKQRAKLVSIAVEDVEVDGTPGLGVRIPIRWCLECALPPRRALPFIVETGGQREEIFVIPVEPEPLGD